MKMVENLPYGEIFRYIWKISEKLIMFKDLMKRLFEQPKCYQILFINKFNQLFIYLFIF